MNGNGYLKGSDFLYTPETLRSMRSMIQLGLHPNEAARRLGCREATFRAICLFHAIPLRPRPERRLDPELRDEFGPRARPLDLRLDQDAIYALEQEARRRHTNVAVLAAVLLEEIGKRNLFDTALD